MNPGRGRIGRYVPRDSFWHRLDPRTKILLPVLLGAGMAAADLPPLVWGSVLLFALAAIAGGLPGGELVSPIPSAGWLLVLTFAGNLLLLPGTALGWMPGTREGLASGSLMTGRLVMMLLVVQLLMASTTPVMISKGTERLFARIPGLAGLAGRFGIVLSLTLRFVPILLAEWETIRASATVRGYLAGPLSVRQRLTRESSLLVPLVVNAFRRAEDLALAMHLRGYDPDMSRTSMVPLRFGLPDAAVLAVAAVAAAGLAAW